MEVKHYYPNRLCLSLVAAMMDQSITTQASSVLAWYQECTIRAVNYFTLWSKVVKTEQY
jgi:hypothetical protein